MSGHSGARSISLDRIIQLSYAANAMGCARRFLLARCWIATLIVAMALAMKTNVQRKGEKLESRRCVEYVEGRFLPLSTPPRADILHCICGLLCDSFIKKSRYYTQREIDAGTQAACGGDAVWIALHRAVQALRHV